MKRYIPAACLLLMLLCCTIIYSNHFYNAFHFDDYHTVVNNAYIRALHNIPLFFKDGSTSSILPANQSYRPVVTTSLAIDYRLAGGYNPFFFHLSTFIIFLLQGIALVFIYKKIADEAVINANHIYFAIAVTSWYLLHPAIAETINYIIARSDVLSTFFIVAALLLYMYSPFCRKTGLYLILVIIGALAKPSAVMFAPVLFFYILFFEEKLSIAAVFKRQNLHKTWACIKKALPSFITCALVYALIGKLTPKTWVPGGTSAWHYLITQPYVILHYFYMLLLPVRLSVDTDWVPLSSIWDIRFFAGMLFLLAIIAIAVVTSKKQALKPVSFGICWFLLALLPASSIVPLAEVVNDHRMYFPFIGIMLSVCWCLRLLIQRCLPYLKNNLPVYKWVLGFILIVVFSSYAYGTWQRNKVWHTDEGLWRDAALKSPLSGRVFMNYGAAQMQNNELAAAKKSFLRAAKLFPGYALVYVNLGVLYSVENDTAGAIKYFKKAIAVNLLDADCYYYYGRFWYGQNQLKAAAYYLSIAVELAPGNLQGRLLLMDIYQAMGNWPALGQLVQQSEKIFPANQDIAVYETAARHKMTEGDIAAQKLSEKPDAGGYIDLGLIYYNEGLYEKCIAASRKALELKPGYDLAYNNICAAYNALKQWNMAIQAGRQGLKFNPNNAMLKNNIAAAYNGKSGKQ